MDSNGTKFFKPRIGRPILEGLRISTRGMLVTAANRFAEAADAARSVESVLQYGSGRVSCFMEGVFHAETGERENEDDEE